jgi:hypothetical protein
MTSILETESCYECAEEIFTLIDAFEDCTLPRSSWTHASHLTVAMWYLLHHSLEDATKIIRNGIKRYNAAHGIVTTPTGGYHETLTIFWISMVRNYLNGYAGPEVSFVALANGLIESCGNSKLPFEFYSREFLFSPEARAEFVEPDLKPLP